MSTLNFETIKAQAIAAQDSSEANLRKQLAYLYRIFHYYGWCDLIVTHLSVRVPNEDALLILPFGVAFNEITPDNLIKVNFDGEILESKYGFTINFNGTTVHRAIYREYKHINCVLHTHSNYGVAVSNLEQKLLLLDQIGMMFYNKIGYHNFDRLFINDNSQSHLLEDMRNKQCMILKNHGLISVGNSITQAFWFHYYLELTCKNHILTASAGTKIHMPDEEVVKQTAEKYEYWQQTTDVHGISDSLILFEAAKRQVGYIFG